MKFLPLTLAILAATAVVAYGVFFYEPHGATITAPASLLAEGSNYPPITLAQTPAQTRPQSLGPVLPVEQTVTSQLEAERDPAARSGFYADTQCKRALEEAKADLAIAREKRELREKQWENYRKEVNDMLRRHGLPTTGRVDDERVTRRGAVNDGLYGEGRPSTGAYGHSRVQYGTVGVDCPNYQK